MDKNFKVDRNLVEQIVTFRNLPKESGGWRIAFYHIAKEFWNLPEVYIVLDKNLYEQGLKIPVFREYKQLTGIQMFSNYAKALAFVEKTDDMFISNGKKLIAKIKNGAFREVFSPFFAEQEFVYILNENDCEFIDTFERLIKVMEADDNYIVDEEQEQLLLEKNVQGFFSDICKKYIVLED